MKILAVADIHNDIENILQFLSKASVLKFDVIVCPGDFTDLAPKGFSQEEIGRLVVDELKSVGKPVLGVPGNLDLDVIKILEEEGISIHGEGKIVEDVGFFGFGGAKTPFGTSYEPSEAEIENGIRKSYKDIKGAKFKVMVTHSPPKNTKLDMIVSGAHVGSEIVRKLIEELKPEAVVCAHIHEARGVDVVGASKAINPGRFSEGYCGIIEVNDSGVTAKVVNLI